MGGDNYRRDNENNIWKRITKKTTKEKQLKAERSKGNRSYSESVRTKWLGCVFKLGFL